MTQSDILQKFIGSNNAAIYLKDDQGRFLMVNNRVAKMFTASKEEIIGKTDFDFFSMEEAEMFRANDGKVAEAGSPMSFKATISSRDGPHTVFDHNFPVSNIEGSPNPFGGIAIEATKIE